MQPIVQKCINIGFPQALCSRRARTQVMSFGRILSRAAASRTEDNERQLFNDMKALSKSVAAYNKQIPKASELDQLESLKRLKRDSPPEWSIITAIGDRTLEIVGLETSMMHLPPGPGLTNTTQQRDQILLGSCLSTPTDDPATGPYPRTMAEATANSAGPVDGQQLPDVVPRHSQAGNIDPVIDPMIGPVTSGIFQGQANYLKLKKLVGFGRYIYDANFSPTSKNLFITGSDGYEDFKLGIWQQGADGTWLSKGEVAGSAPFCHYELNRSEDTLLSSSNSGNVKVSTLNSDGCWEESVVLALTPHHVDYPPVQVTFSPLQDKIMAYDHQASSIIVLRKENGQWVSLTPPISHYQQTGPQQPHFKATDHYILAYQGKAVTIWGFSDKGNHLEKKGVFECDRIIASAQLSDDERHAVIFTWGSQALFLGCDDDGNWSQIGTICHPEKMINDENQVHTNLIYQAAFNTSGQHALTRDLDKRVIISGYDDSGAWVIKAEIEDCAEARFSPSGDKLLACQGSGLSMLWDRMNTDDPLDIGQVLEHTGSREVVFSPSENRLLSYGSGSDVACIWGNDEEGNLVEEARICHQGGIGYAAFNAREDSVLTHGRDHTVKIHGLDSQGKWQEKLVFQHPDSVPDAGSSIEANLLNRILPNNILYARFSSSGRHAFFVSLDDTACILGQDDNGQWTEQAVMDSGDYSIDGADFNGLGNHFLIYSNKINDKNQPGLVQLWGIGGDGKWVKREQIKLFNPVNQAKFSPDSEHLVIYCNDDPRGFLLSKLSTALLWKIPASPGQETAQA